MKHHNHRHGHAAQRTPTYRSWETMRRRCLVPTASDYPTYGGAGVTVHARWDDFATFLADMGARPPGTTLDRLDGTVGYEPGNCRWATPAQQARNRRSNRMLTYQGETLCVAAWAERTGLSSVRILKRLRLGWPVEKTLGS